jgi:hypothetical protein
VRSVFFVTLIPCALSHALCSACALVSAAVLGSLTLLGFGVDSLITRVIGMIPADSADEFSRLLGRVQRFLARCRGPDAGGVCRGCGRCVDFIPDKGTRRTARSVVGWRPLFGRNSSDAEQWP